MKKNSYPYIIAEIAQAHEGSLGIAHSLIDAANEAGASAVKFQFHLADQESSKDEPWRVPLKTQDKTRFDYWKRMEFSEESWIKLKSHTKKVGLDFICSPFSIKAVDALNRIGVDGWKIASGEVSNYPMLRKISKLGKPIFLSSGLSHYDEIKKAIEILDPIKNKITVMQCTSEYPVSSKNLGLNVIGEFKKRFGLNTGFSDHSGNIYSGLAAISLGASVIEVHLTFSKKMFGPDAESSLEPNDLNELVQGSRWIHESLSNPVNKDKPSKKIKDMRKIFMKSIVAKSDISKGQKLSSKNLTTKKPLIGIEANYWDEVLNSVAKRKIKKNNHLHWDDLLNKNGK